MGHIVDGNSYMLSFKIEADEDAELETPYIKELYLEFLQGEKRPPKNILEGLLELSKKVNSIMRPKQEAENDSNLHLQYAAVQQSKIAKMVEETEKRIETVKMMVFSS